MAVVVGVIVAVIVAVVAVLAVVWLALLFSMRTGFQPGLDVVRRLNRAWANPRQLRTAGQPGAYASVVHHVGRTSGTDYRTPVVPVATEDGFLVALPYGPDADWVRNVLAVGTAKIEHHGETWQVARPRLVSFEEANPAFPAKDQRTHRIYGVSSFLRVDRLPGDGAPDEKEPG